VAAQAQARGRVVEQDFLALGRGGQLHGRLMHRHAREQRGLHLQGRCIPHLLAAVA